MAKPIHSMIRVLDESRSVDFYRRAMGLEVAERFAFESFTLIYMRDPSSTFELELTVNLGRTEPYQLGDGYGHFAVAVDDLDAQRATMLVAGAAPGDIKGTQARRCRAGPVLLRQGSGRLQHRGSAKCRPFWLENKARKRGEHHGERSINGPNSAAAGCSAPEPPRCRRRHSSPTSISATAAWAEGAKTISPHAMATLVLVARDIYPHDHIADVFYIKAVTPWDAKAGKDAGVRDMIMEGIARLDADAADRHKANYLGLGWEADRVALLRGIEETKFFRTIRADLVVSLYNQPDIWPKFGYEGLLGRVWRLHQSRIQRHRLATVGLGEDTAWQSST